MLLLVVLALLAMFGLIAVTFVLVTRHAMRSSRAIQRMGQYQTQPQEELDEALLQVVRGSNNPASVLGPHSLLEDLYGNDSVAGTVLADGNAVQRCGGQIIEFNVSGVGIEDPYRCVGCVLTMLDGPAAGRSTRIVGYVQATNRFQVLAFEGVDTAAVVAYVGSGGQECNYVLNGTPFSGTGFGFNPGIGELDATNGVAEQYLALLPNAPENRNPPGGANEDYDAVDFQNMLLARTSGGIIPSLHRPALVRYWMNHPTADWANNLDLQRSVILRPLPQDNYTDVNGNSTWDAGDLDFSGKLFELFDPVNVLDVDNDGDGQLDGVWVDLGMPVRSTADGRLYKPLFSVLCVDLDGRLNVNAHGNTFQSNLGYYNADKGGPGVGINPDLTKTAGAAWGYAQFAGANPGPVSLPRGQGYGPAEINLLPLFDGAADPFSEYQKLLFGNAGLAGRYGEIATTATASAGVSGVDDFASQNEARGYAGNYWGSLAGGAQLDAFGSPPNVAGLGTVGLDVAGRPLYLTMCVSQTETVDDPYELNLSREKARGLASPEAVDNPFSLSELERLLRPFDRDACRLPGRLAELLSIDPKDPSSVARLRQLREEITTESWDVPCPAVAVPKDLRDDLPDNLPRHVTDMLRAKGVPEGAWAELLPPELLAGQKMDLNQPLGNARDDNANGVVDEPGEPGEQLTLYSRPGATAAVSFSYSPDGAAANSLAARQLLARHLYVLMMLLADTDYLAKDLGGMDGVARFLAQWAVNVVDFRDRDSIMTPFEYDPDPFVTDSNGDGNPWDPDGNPATPDGIAAAHVVWGCERPELLINETLAFHGRRTEDLKTPGGKTDGDPPDPDFDQKLRPQGSLFVELFNPWTAMEPPPGELYPSGQRGVMLAAVAPGGSPVWRLLVVKPDEDPQHPGEHRDPDDPVTGNRPSVDRSVYFADVAGLGFDDPNDGQVAYYPSDPGSIAPVMPGRYAVIGPGEPNQVIGTTYIGQRTDGLPTQTRQIVLTPNSNPDAPGQVQVKYNRGAGDDLAAMPIQPPTAVVIDLAQPAVPDAVPRLPRRLSISEPADGYPLKDAVGADDYNEATGGYTQPYDQPMDAGGPMEDEVMRKNGTTTGVRIVHLQRLANPLLAWDSLSNPYLTIDSAPVDLTAFNGATSDPEKFEGNPIPDADTMFHARQRGEKQQDVHAWVNNLWKQEPTGKTVNNDATSIEPTVTSHYFTRLLKHTLGYLNEPFGSPNAAAGYVGDPQLPFPWLNWNNRPFVSQLELLLVPALRSSKLLVCNDTNEHRYYRFVQSGVSPDPYGQVPLDPASVPFTHLMPLFNSQDKGDPQHSSAQLHRLLEYVCVPSRFVGSRLQGNPAAFAAEAAGTHTFFPPFNEISRYREPGRINLNTIFDQKVFEGLMNSFPGMETNEFWNSFVKSRRGIVAGNESQYPTDYARPFRSFAGAEMVPPLDELKPDREIDLTLLRPDPDNPTRPLFQFDSVLLGGAAPAYCDPDRNPYFRYEGLQRLGNLVTTRSNVYAIWITVGYFEVEPMPAGYNPAVYPDGYRLLGELGTDTGEVQRHRGFYIYDRSIPVGFRRGENLSAEEGLLVRRFIE